MENKPLYVVRDEKGILLKILSTITLGICVASISGIILIFLTSIFYLIGIFNSNISEEYMGTLLLIAFFMFVTHILIATNYTDVKFYTDELAINHATVFKKKETKYKYKDIYALKRIKNKIYFICKNRNTLVVEDSIIDNDGDRIISKIEKYYTLIGVKNKHYEKIKEIIGVYDLETFLNNIQQGELLEEKEYKNKKYQFFENCIQYYDIKNNDLIKKIDYNFVVSTEINHKYELDLFMKYHYYCKLIIKYILPNSKKIEKLYIRKSYKKLNFKELRTQYLINWSKFENLTKQICLAQRYDEAK